MGHLDSNISAGLDLLNWPIPPYFNYRHDPNKPAYDLCIVEIVKDKAHTGYLVRHSPEEARILFKPLHSNTEQVISFDKIKSLQLLWPTELVAEQKFLEARANEDFPTAEPQTFHLEFNDESTLEGKTLGHIYNEAGLYLYSVLNDGKVERRFIPRQAIKNHQIGPQIGEILIEENLVSANDIESALEHQNEIRKKRIGDYLNESQILTSEQLHKAIEHQEKLPVLKLGEALRQLDLLTDEQLQDALNKQKQNRNMRLGQILVEMGIVDERTLKGALAKKLGVPYVNLENFNFDANAIRIINAPLARKHHIMPLCLHQGALVVGIEDPMNAKVLDELRFITQLKILPAIASYEDIGEALNSYYSQNFPSEYEDLPTISHNYDGSLDFDLENGRQQETGINDLASRLFDEDKSNLREVVEEQPIAESDNTLVQLVNKMILDAVKNNASDIHIETYPDRKNTIVRFRKDGSLENYLELPANFRNALISRIKIMSQLDISERRKPQDGKLDFQQFGNAKVELRVATIPTANGLEDIVMRVLAASKPLPMKSLGLSADALASMEGLVHRSYGLILVCGPTGSGKTTTLHSLLGHINTPQRKIWTAEDPIEITQPGLRQVQVNAKIGWTFAQAMRSFLRADPDVIMVGEMRDEETTKIGIEASLTGHLVLSTLHTNSAPESIVRMLDLGMDPFNFADALVGILAQRLAKKLCIKCKEAYTPEETELEELAAEYSYSTNIDRNTLLEQWKSQHSHEGKITLHRAKGCRHCNNTGYRGRLGLYELMTVNPELKQLIQKRATVSEITAEALNNGMTTLKQDGIKKIFEGETDIAQVRAVCA
ncbi:MAG TPA: ATPase, T2SS/T4P/T4SS family [Methylophilus sp.]|nr:ATPase, T2SS/T4P/T4SS family [Methylophilus sp.]HQQ33562.1 ATPase, T2SS/T4P/T4SS family [Methylophilus sp.]